MNIQIKDSKNIEEIVSLNRFVHDIHHRNHPDVFREYDYNSMLKNLGEWISHDHIKCFTAYDGESPVGFILFYKRDYPDHIFKKGHCSVYLDQICVKPEYRKKGLGRRLMDELTSYCRENGIGRIELSVWSDNQNAQAFFKKMGFDPYLENMKKDL
ncbi:MAG: GNAT family N-acetyltransferase [Spirochaetales bacterium]|nr:GNAT family N-acetyltransferase [Spirochaetales bacterium]